MSEEHLHRLLKKAVARRGQEAVAKTLGNLLSTSPDIEVMTIIANAGVHKIPEQYLRGEVYAVSHGNWGADSQQILMEELTGILSRLCVKLRSRPWKTVYLIPTGHPILSVQIKTMVYRLLRLNTIDLYHKAGEYFEVDIDHRELALAVQPTNDEGTGNKGE